LIINKTGSKIIPAAIFFALISRQKNMKPEKALLHTPTGVLHKNEAFSDEATSL
jgi:hypothetical protein